MAGRVHVDNLGEIGSRAITGSFSVASLMLAEPLLSVLAIPSLEATLSPALVDQHQKQRLEWR